MGKLLTDIDEIVRASEHARDAMYAISAEVDRSGDPSAAMQLAWQAGIHRLSIPRSYGGLSDGSINFQAEAVARALINIVEGEPSCGQMVATQMLHLRMTFAPASTTGEAVKQAIARSFLERETRYFGAVNPTGVPNRPGLIATRVDGGIVVNGSIAFATQSNGAHGFVTCLAWMLNEAGDDYEMVAGETMLGRDGVIVHNDWDNMGQRATGSGMMSFKDVFIPDGWWHRRNLLNAIQGGGGNASSGGSGPLGALLGFPIFGIIMQGMGQAALRAEVEFLKTRVDRPLWPIFEGPMDDVLVHVRLGKHKTAIESARAFVLKCARDAELADAAADRLALQMQAAEARQVATQAAINVASDLFELTGARSTASKYNMDRFWRNARTFGIHDASDIDFAAIGYHALHGELPAALRQRMTRLLVKPQVPAA